MDSWLEDRTWQWRNGLLSWGMRVPRSSAVAVDELVHRCVVGAVSTLGDFAAVVKVSWKTAAGGEGAVVRPFHSDDRADAVALLTGSPVAGAVAADVDLDLGVVFPDEPVERTIAAGGVVFVEYYEQFPVVPGGSEGEVVILTVSLNVDIYARESTRGDGENRILADLNAPRLNRFLRELQAHLGYQFSDMEYEGDASQIDHNGFVGHDDPKD